MTHYAENPGMTRFDFFKPESGRWYMTEALDMRLHWDAPTVHDAVERTLAGSRHQDLSRWIISVLEPYHKAAKPNLGACPDFQQAAVRHIARNCDMECGCENEETTCGWDRYETAPALDMLIRTIDAQIKLLSNTLDIRPKYAELGMEARWISAVERAGNLDLARAINGKETK